MAQAKQATQDPKKRRARMRDESWKAIPGYEGRYDVSNRGRVRSYYRMGRGQVEETPQRVLRPGEMSGGYPLVSLHDGAGAGAGASHLVHRLVMLAFVGPCPEGMECNHLDGDKTNNRIENLEYVTKSENAIHAYANGLAPKGEDHGRSKLTESNVKEIRKLYATGKYLQRELGARFGIAQTQVSSIVRREQWAHI
jgi:hypothetical protein